MKEVVRITFNFDTLLSLAILVIVTAGICTCSSKNIDATLTNFFNFFI